MNQPLLTEIVGDIRYQVFLDPDQDYELIFEPEEYKEEYYAKFETGELINAYVVKEGFCKCCKGWEFIHSLGAIHAESPEGALALYRQDYEEANND